MSEQKSRVYTVRIEEDGDDAILPIPDGLMEELGWLEGDELRWIILPGNTVALINISSILRNQNNTQNYDCSNIEINQRKAGEEAVG